MHARPTDRHACVPMVFIVSVTVSVWTRNLITLMLLLDLLQLCCSGGTDKQVVIVEEHQHALSYWYHAARKTLKLTGTDARARDARPKVLIHIDTHDDLALPRSGSFAPWDDGDAPVNVFVTRNDCFILDAVVRGLVDEIVFVRLVSDHESKTWSMLQKLRRRDNMVELAAMPHYSGVIKIGVIMHRIDGATTPSLWTEGADKDSPAAVPVWCVCGDPAGIHSHDDNGLWEVLLGRKDTNSGNHLPPPCYYNEKQALQNPNATTPEEIARARQWGEKSEMSELPEGTFCNLAKDWQQGEVLEWPSDGRAVVDSWRTAEGNVNAEGGVHEATVHVALLLRGRGQGRIAGQEIATAVHNSREHGSFSGRWKLCCGMEDTRNRDEYRWNLLSWLTQAEGASLNDDHDLRTRRKDWILDIDEDFFFPNYSPAVVLHHEGANEMAMENLWWSLRPLEFYTATQEHQMDQAFRETMVAMRQASHVANDTDVEGRWPQGLARQLDKWTEELAGAFESWQRELRGEKLRQAVREVLHQLLELPTAVRNSLEEIGFCKSMMSTSSDEEYGIMHPETDIPTFDDFAHVIPSHNLLQQHRHYRGSNSTDTKQQQGNYHSDGTEPQDRLVPMRLNICVGESWFDQEHIDEIEADSAGEALHPDRIELRERSLELREFLEEIASARSSTVRTDHERSGTAMSEGDVQDLGLTPLVSGAPLITTICRSNRDGYAPRNETVAVESAVLNHLHALGWTNGETRNDWDSTIPSEAVHKDPWLLGSIGTGEHEDL